MADRNPDPDHPFDLALRRPARLKRALNGFQQAGSPRTAGFVLSSRPPYKPEGSHEWVRGSLNESAEDSGCADIASATTPVS